MAGARSALSAMFKDMGITGDYRVHTDENGNDHWSGNPVLSQEARGAVISRKRLAANLGFKSKQAEAACIEDLTLFEHHVHPMVNYDVATHGPDKMGWRRQTLPLVYAKAMTLMDFVPTVRSDTVANLKKGWWNGWAG